MSEGGGLLAGLRGSATMTVTEAVTVPRLPAEVGDLADMPPVLATACMVAFIETTCVAALRPVLDAAQRTVGTRVDVDHRAATPIGMQVTADVELIAVEGRRLRFRVACRDEVETIGEGHHERAIIDVQRFMTGIEGKRTRAATPARS